MPPSCLLCAGFRLGNLARMSASGPRINWLLTRPAGPTRAKNSQRNGAKVRQELWEGFFDPPGGRTGYNPPGMAITQKHRFALGGLVMLLSLAMGGLYYRANLPPRPAAYWLAPYPTNTESQAELQRRAESTPVFREAMSAFEQQRRRIALRALAVGLLGGAALFVLCTAFNKRFHRPLQNSE